MIQIIKTTKNIYIYYVFINKVDVMNGECIIVSIIERTITLNPCKGIENKYIVIKKKMMKLCKKII